MQIEMEITVIITILVFTDYKSVTVVYYGLVITILWSVVSRVWIFIWLVKYAMQIHCFISSISFNYVFRFGSLQTFIASTLQW